MEIIREQQRGNLKEIQILPRRRRDANPPCHFVNHSHIFQTLPKGRLDTPILHLTPSSQHSLDSCGRFLSTNGSCHQLCDKTDDGCHSLLLPFTRHEGNSLISGDTFRIQAKAKGTSLGKTKRCTTEKPRLVVDS